MTNPFLWQDGQPSVTGASLGRTQTKPKTAPKPITYSKKPAHHLRPMAVPQNTSIATPQPVKQKPASGKFSSI